MVVFLIYESKRRDVSIAITETLHTFMFALPDSGYATYCPPDPNSNHTPYPNKRCKSRKANKSNKQSFNNDFLLVITFVAECVDISTHKSTHRIEGFLARTNSRFRGTCFVAGCGRWPCVSPRGKSTAKLVLNKTHILFLIALGCVWYY